MLKFLSVRKTSGQTTGPVSETEFQARLKLPKVRRR